MCFQYGYGFRALHRCYSYHVALYSYASEQLVVFLRHVDGIFISSRDSLSIPSCKYYISPEKRQTLSVIKAVTTKENIFMFPITKILIYLTMQQYIHRHKTILYKPLQHVCVGVCGWVCMCVCVLLLNLLDFSRD